MILLAGTKEKAGVVHSLLTEAQHQLNISYLYLDIEAADALHRLAREKLIAAS